MPSVSKALATRLTVERVCRLALLTGAVIETVGGEPVTLATVTFEVVEVALRELASVTRAVRAWAPSCEASGVHVME